FSLSNDALRFAPPHPPVVTPPANISVATAPPATSGDLRIASSAAVGSCAAVVDPGIATATTDAASVTVVGVRSDGLPLDAAYPKGVTTIKWTATDADGMTASAVQTITVVDKENPSITTPQNISVGNDPHLPSAVVAVGSAEAADNCPDVKISSARGDGTASDAAGNSTSATFLVTVLDAHTHMSNLIQYVLGLGLPDGTTNPLVNQLEAAFGSFDGDNHVACVKMGDFIGMVSTKARDILSGSSAYMISEATRIESVLGCSIGGRGHPQLMTPDISG